MISGDKAEEVFSVTKNINGEMLFTKIYLNLENCI